MSTLSAALSVPGLLRRQYEPRERIDSAIVAGAAAALRYARANVPAYADRRYEVGPLTDLDDIARLPVLRKVDVIAAGTEPYHSREFADDAVRVATTSGSTGLMLRSRHDRANYE